MLVPATAEDLKNAGKVTVSPSAQSEAVKAVQIKVGVIGNNQRFFKKCNVKF